MKGLTKETLAAGIEEVFKTVKVEPKARRYHSMVVGPEGLKAWEKAIEEWVSDKIDPIEEKVEEKVEIEKLEWVDIKEML